MIPEAGGEYALLTARLRPRLWILFGWIIPSLAALVPSRPSRGMMRFSASPPNHRLAVFSPCISPFPASLAGQAVRFCLHWRNLSRRLLLIMTGVNYLGVRLGGAVQIFLTHHQITSVAIVIGVAFFAPASTQASGSQPFGRMQEWALAPSSALFLPR